MRYDTPAIIAAIQAAVVAANEADALDPEDGGTCNMDSAYLRVKGMQQKQAQEIIDAVKPVTVVLQDYSWHGRVLMILHSHGQANRRARMCEAAYKSLTASGLPCGQYLQMD